MLFERCTEEVLTKTELIKAIAEEASLTKVDAEKTVKAFLDAVTDCLVKGDKLTLVGFGTFSTAARAARKGQNPQTGKKIDIPASIAPKFKAGNTLKDTVNS